MLVINLCFEYFFFSVGVGKHCKHKLFTKVVCLLNPLLAALTTEREWLLFWLGVWKAKSTIGLKQYMNWLYDFPPFKTSF